MSTPPDILILAFERVACDLITITVDDINSALQKVINQEPKI
jgi:hypothetical protein